MGDSGFQTLEQADGLLDELTAGLERLRDGWWWKVTGDDLLNVGRRVERLARVMYATQLRFVDEVQGQGMAANRSCSSTGSLVRQVLNIHPGDARARVKAAALLLPQDSMTSADTMPAVLPVVSAALDGGGLGAAHVGVIVDAMKAVPALLGAEVRDACERTLVDHAVQTDPEQLRKIADHLLDVLNPDGSLDPDKDPATDAELQIGARNRRTGLTPIRGKLDDEGIGVLAKALDGLSKPRPLADGLRDPRSAATRQAHALVEVLRVYLNTGQGPIQGGVQPHLTVLIDYDAVKQAATTAMLDTGASLSPGQLRRLLCDARVVPAVLGGPSEVLDVGRASRTFTAAIRTAITLRDRGCVWPGCDRPPSHCEIHHVAWWVRDFGSTSYGSGAMTCDFHHDEVHKGEWIMRMSPDDGRVELIPPKWLDPQQTPRRNDMHHLTTRLRT